MTTSPTPPRASPFASAAVRSYAGPAGLAACATLAAALVGCGGSESVPDTPTPSVPIARAQALASQQVETVQDVLDWAEQAFPQFFPGHETDQQYEGATYRHYAGTGNYFGMYGDHVLIMGPMTGGGLVDLGSIWDYRCLITPQACADEQPIEARWARIAAGPAHTLVVNAQGAGLGWGDGLAGVSGVELPGTPARAIGGLNLVAGLRAGNGFTLAVTRDGRLLYLRHGAAHSLLPNAGGGLPTQALPVPGASRIVDATSCEVRGATYVVALKADGALWSMGVDANGVIYSPQEASTRVSGFSSSGPGSADNYVCAIDAIDVDGRPVKISVTLGQLHKSRQTRIQINQDAGVDLGTRVLDLACTNINGAKNHCLAVTAAGRVLGWGDNPSGQVGLDSYRNTTVPSGRPATVDGLSDVIRVWATVGASYALTRDGWLYAWGAHVGPEPSSPSHVPRRQFASDGPVADLAVQAHLAVLMRDGSVRTWGANSSAQLGKGDRTAATAPVTPAAIRLGTPASLSMPPVARIAAQDGAPRLNTAITLRDGGSRDADGDPLTWHWTLAAKPETSNAALDTTASTTARFTPDRYGTYTVALVVNDGRSDSRPAQVTFALAEPATTSSLPAPLPQETAILQSRNCLACHAIDRKLVGPSFQDIANKYRGSAVPLATLQAQLQTSIAQGSLGRWGQVPMPPNTQGTADELTAIVNWLLVRRPPKK